MPLRRPHVDPPGKVYVSSLSKLPAPVDGVITLEADTCYEFTRHLDLLGARLECAEVVCITGASILGRVESLVSRAVVTLAPGDYVEAWVANGSGTADITVSDLSLTATL